MREYQSNITFRVESTNSFRQIMLDISAEKSLQKKKCLQQQCPLIMTRISEKKKQMLLNCFDTESMIN